MSIIDFNLDFSNYDVNITEKQRAEKYYQTNKEHLKFNIGDKVKVIIPKEYEKQYKNLKDKVFKIIDIELTFDIKEPLSFKLNTNTDICLFKSKYLELA